MPGRTVRPFFCQHCVTVQWSALFNTSHCKGVIIALLKTTNWFVASVSHAVAL
jgi:hypothetical protein